MGLLDPPGFRRNRRGELWLHLPETERDLLQSLLTQLGDMLDSEEPDGRGASADPLEELVGIESSAERPDDPAMARLFPDAYEDAELAAEFRRFTQRDLRTGKRRNQQAALDTLARPDPTRLSAEEAQAWLSALNDLRLTLGTRLEVTEHEPRGVEDLPPDDPVRALYAVYDWLTYHQERLVAALQKGLRS